MSLTTKLSRSSNKSSLASYSCRPSQSPVKSPVSPKPKDQISSAHSSKTSGKLSQHDAQKKITGTEKSPSATKSSADPSMPTLMKQRSQVSKPPSTGSVRLIRVTPAPSMSSARHRSGKHSSTSVVKQISGKTSGGSVRIINVSPAASTVIGPRRPSQQFPSETRVKTSSVVSFSSATAGGEQKVSISKSSSRPISSGDIQNKGTFSTAASPLDQKPEEASQPPVTLAVDGQPLSLGSFVIIDTPTEISPSANKQSGESTGFTVVSSDLEASNEPQTCHDMPHTHLEANELNESDCNASSKAKLDEKSQGGSTKATSPEESKRALANGGTEDQLHPSGGETRSPLLHDPPTEENTGRTTSKDLASPQDENAQGGQQSGKNVPHSQGAAVGRRSKSIISAVIERLSKMFSGQAQPSRTLSRGKQQSETNMGALSKDVKSEYMIHQCEGGVVRHSQSTGTTPVIQPFSNEPIGKTRKCKTKTKGVSLLCYLKHNTFVRKYKQLLSGICSWIHLIFVHDFFLIRK